MYKTAQLCKQAIYSGLQAITAHLLELENGVGLDFVVPRATYTPTVGILT
jgi:hypothetical protein